MWFRRAQRPTHETARDELKLGTSLVKTDVNGSAALPPVSYYVDDAPNVRPPSAEPTVPTGPMELRARHTHLKQFEPGQRRLARNLVIGAGASNQVYSSYNYLRTQILHRLQENGWNTVAITSPSRAAGNTLTAINLAISIARNYNYTVLLVELDLVNPSFRRILGFEQREGLVDHLLHDMPVSEIMLDPGIEGLVVIPAGSPVTNSSELLSSPKMTRLVEELKLRYKHLIVLFDLPSVLSTDDAMAFSPFVDCALLVVEEGETRVNDVRRALDYLRSTKILGVVLNRSNEAQNDARTTAR